MKTLKITLICSALIFSATASAGWLDFLNQTDEAAEAVQNTATTIQAIDTVTNTAAGVSQVSLVDTLVKQLGVSPAQASGGSGALFQVAKDKMTESAFSQLSQSVPGMNGLLAAVPQAKPASESANLLGGLAAATGNASLVKATSLVNTFKQLDLSKGMVSQFTPILINYVKQNGGELTANLLKTALMGI